MHELAYQYEMSNREIADLLKNQPRKALIIADSAEPKSIAELRDFGLTVLPADKGPDSVTHGIQIVKEQQISITRSSTNTIKERDNYAWKVDNATGVLTEYPEDKWNHSMDGIRYVISSVAPILQRKEYADNQPRRETRKKPNPAR